VCRQMPYTRPPSRSDACSMSLMRVCQPSPVARSAASTSGSSRSFTACLWAVALERPRRINFQPSYRSASCSQASVISSASSGSTQGGADGFDFAFIGLSHADDAARLAARCANQYDQAVIQPASGRKPVFGVVLLRVDSGQVL